MAEANWYVVHTYSGYENKVKANIEKTIENRHLEEEILEVRVPMEDVVEVKEEKSEEVADVKVEEDPEVKPIGEEDVAVVEEKDVKVDEPTTPEDVAEVKEIETPVVEEKEVAEIIDEPIDNTPINVDPTSPIPGEDVAQVEIPGDNEIGDCIHGDLLG